MEKSPIADVRSIMAKIEKQQEMSGTYSFQLLQLKDGTELYERVQQSESEVREAREATLKVLSAYGDEKKVFEAIEKKLLALTRLGADSCSIVGIDIAEDVLKADAGDARAAALHIAHYLARVPHFGKGLARALTEQREVYVAAQERLGAAATAVEETGRAVKSAFYNAASVIAQAKALLSGKGITVQDRKAPTRTRKKAISAPTPVAPPVAAQPEPAPATGPAPVLVYTFSPRSVPEAA